MMESSLLEDKSDSNNFYKYSRDGYAFDQDSYLWRLNKDVTISFQEEVLSLNSELLQGFKQALSRYAEELSAHHTSNMYLRFQRFIRDTKCEEIDVNSILNWRSMLNDENEWYLGSLRGFLISWHDFGYYGVSKKVVNLLNKMTLKCNLRGLAVSNRCPYTGALTQNEQLAFHSELNRLFLGDKISITEFVYLLLLEATARRPVQLRQLKGQDLIKITNNESGAVNYYLNIPRAKQRGGGFRKEFKSVAITEDIYLIALNLIENNFNKIKRELNVDLMTEQKSDLPLFIDWKSLINFIKEEHFNINDEVLHISTTGLANELKKVARVQHSVSERTGDIIHISAIRFRRTRGTNLGKKGISVFIIAEVLDHSDKQSAQGYVENTADSVTYIDEAVGPQLAPFAQAFKGIIINDLSDGERGGDTSSFIPNRKNEVVGACGTNDFCIKGYESCYVCEKFRPLLDAPHEKFLDALYKEKNERLKATRSEQYASTKDTLIMAVEWVVQKCNRMKSAGDEK
jgi:integrase